MWLGLGLGLGTEMVLGLRDVGQARADGLVPVLRMGLGLGLGLGLGFGVGVGAGLGLVRVLGGHKAVESATLAAASSSS